MDIITIFGIGLLFLFITCCAIHITSFILSKRNEPHKASLRIMRYFEPECKDTEDILDGLIEFSKSDNFEYKI